MLSKVIALIYVINSVATAQQIAFCGLGYGFCWNGGTCMNSGNAYACMCPCGYDGVLCNEVVTGANCEISNPVADSIIDGYCGMNPGTCYNGGICESSGTAYKCVCPMYTGGHLCELIVDTDYCSNLNPCEGRGTCMNVGDSYICMCNEGYSGTNCEFSTVEGYCGLQSGPCLNGGTCIDSGNAYKCNCPEAFIGTRCETETTSDPCSSSPCANGGTCRNVGVGASVIYLCTCSMYYSGDMCDDYALADLCGLQEGLCLNGGTCIDSGNAYKCKCPEAFIGTRCETETTSDPCSSGPCANGGTCRNVGVGASLRYFCTCPMYYYGDTCNDYALTDTCGFQDGLCSNGGTCTPSGNSFKCACTGNFVGLICVEEDPASPCSSSPCQNGGTCMNVFTPSGGQEFRCDCSFEYTGLTCQNTPTDYCVEIPNVCNNQGTCINSGNYFKCLCEGNMVGDNCESPDAGAPCQSNPCQNQGTCMNIGTASFICTCNIYFSGTVCETSIVTDYCGLNPGICNNIGICTNSGTYYKCCDANGQNCASGGSSSLVQTPCSPNPCLNGGVCIQSGNFYTCNCLAGTSGNKCQFITSG